MTKTDAEIDNDAMIAEELHLATRYRAIGKGRVSARALPPVAHQPRTTTAEQDRRSDQVYADAKARGLNLPPRSEQTAQRIVR